MSDKILYYPAINLPEGPWTTKSILYWDEIGVIVPDEYAERPELLDAGMLQYLQSGLVTQHFPDSYGKEQYDASNAALALITGAGFNLKSSRDNFILGNARRIHAGKFKYELFDRLINLNIGIKQHNSNWYLIEASVANIMMTYLAATIGAKINHQPATDDSEFINEIDHLKLVENDRSRLRVQILEDIMPYPMHASPHQLFNFKERYSSELKNFRRAIEKKLWIISSIKDAVARENVLNLEIDELKDKKEELISKFNEGKLGRVILSAVKGLVVDGAIALITGDVIQPMATALTGVNETIKGYNGKILKNEDLAFVALMEKKL